MTLGRPGHSGAFEELFDAGLGGVEVFGVEVRLFVGLVGGWLDGPAS